MSRTSTCSVYLGQLHLAVSSLRGLLNPEMFGVVAREVRGVIDTRFFEMLYCFKCWHLSRQAGRPVAPPPPRRHLNPLCTPSSHSCPTFCARLAASKVSLWSLPYTLAYIYNICLHSSNNFVFAPSASPWYPFGWTNFECSALLNKNMRHCRLYFRSPWHKYPQCHER